MLLVAVKVRCLKHVNSGCREEKNGVKKYLDVMEEICI